jgi:hypothetical protein
MHSITYNNSILSSNPTKKHHRTCSQVLDYKSIILFESMDASNMRSRKQSKEKLKQAKSGNYRKGSRSLDLPAIREWATRLFYFATRTALVVFLLRFILRSRGGKNASTPGSPPSVKGTAVAAPNANAVKTVATPVENKPAVAVSPPKTDPPVPAFTGPMKTWEWKNEGEDPIRFSQETQLPEYKNILFLGDSTYSKFAGYVTGSWQQIFPTAAFFEKSSPCERLSYYRLPRGNWVPPDRSKGEGPNMASSPFCGDCADCKSGRIASGGKPYGWEYLFVEYARDVEQPSTTTKTSQETVALYLKQSPHPSRLCVVNTGLYDMALPGITVDVFLNNLKDYLHGIAPSCQNIVWVTIGATMITGGPQSNDNIIVWNSKIKAMLSTDNVLLPKLVYLDAWQASVRAPHNDPIHKSVEFYRALGALFFSPIAKAARGR